MPDAKALFRAWISTVPSNRLCNPRSGPDEMDTEIEVMRLLCEMTVRFAKMGWPR